MLNRMKIFTLALAGISLLLTLGGCCSKNSKIIEEAGKAYQSGDYRKAVLLFLPEADDGNPEAQVNIAFMYYCGMHVEQDYKVAAEWYLKSAKQNNVTAQFSLGTMYENGEGVKQDFAKAYFWYSLAEKQGDKDAAKLRSELEPRLPQKKLSEIKQHIKNWKPIKNK